MAAPTGTIVFALEGPIAPQDIRWLCERVRFLLEVSGGDRLICDVGGVVNPDAGTVEALARMQLTARQLGRRVVLRRASVGLKELVTLAGLTDVLPCDQLPIEAMGHAEQREQPSGVEEEGDPADPVA